MSLQSHPGFTLWPWLTLFLVLRVYVGVAYAQVEGSCKDAGHPTCCTGTSCQGTSDNLTACFCDRDCYKCDNCCEDINETCPQEPCVASGYLSCCVEDNCKTSAGCYCDELCYRFQDCCYDINTISCPEGTFRGDTYLLFANQYAIRRINLDGSSLQTVVTGEEGAAIVGMDFHYRLTNMYWSDNGSNSIMKANLDGSQVSTVISKGLGRVVGLAVDWFTNKLYWTDELYARIDVFDVERSLRKNLIFTGANSTLRGIAVDPSTRWMYWTDWGDPAKMEKASMDGTSRTVLHYTDLVWPNGITLDYEAQVVYWIDAFTDVLEFSNVDGTNRQVLQTEALGHPFGLTLYDKLLYWTDWSELAILSTRKAVGDTVGRIVANLTYPPMSIQVVSSERQRQGENPCSVDNGGCSDLCLLSINSNGYSCDCPEGSVLLDNQKDCLGSCDHRNCCIGQDCLGFPSSHVTPTPTHSVAVSDLIGMIVSPIIPSVVVTESSSPSMHHIPVSLTPTTAAMEPTNTPTTPPPVAIVTSSLFQLQMIGVDKCKDWKEIDVAVKLENVTAAIVENVESDYCTCGFSAEDLVEASFYCFEDVETAVTFCAKLYGTGQINSSEILQFISEWVLKGNAITFGESDLMLSTDCPVEVDSCDNSGCELPFSSSSDVNTGLLIGALVLLTLLLLAAIVTTATVVVRKRTSNARHLLDNKGEEEMQLIERSPVQHTTRETGVGTEVERETDIDSGKEVLLPKKTSSSATQTPKEEELPTPPSYEVHYVTPV